MGVHSSGGKYEWEGREEKVAEEEEEEDSEEVCEEEHEEEQGEGKEEHEEEESEVAGYSHATRLTAGEKAEQPTTGSVFDPLPS